MQAHWLLSELRELQGPDSGFDTSTLIHSLRRKYEGNPSILAEITMKKVSGKLNRLCCMRFLARKQVKREIFVAGGNTVRFRGYKYQYKLTKQGLSYLKYLSEKRRLKNDIGFSRSPHPDPASAVDKNVKPNMEELVSRKVEQKENELVQALREQSAKNHRLEKELDDERSRSMVALAVIVSKARQEVEARNRMIRRIMSHLDTLSYLGSTISRDYLQRLNEILSQCYILPEWMY